MNHKRIWFPDYQNKYSYPAFVLTIFFIRGLVFWILNWVLLCKIIHIFRRVLSQKVIDKDIILQPCTKAAQPCNKVIEPRTSPAVSELRRDILKECPAAKHSVYQIRPCCQAATIPNIFPSTLPVPSIPGPKYPSIGNICKPCHTPISSPELHRANPQSMEAFYPQEILSGRTIYQSPTYPNQQTIQMDSSGSNFSIPGNPMMQQYQQQYRLQQPRFNQTISNQPITPQDLVHHNYGFENTNPRQGRIGRRENVNESGSETSFMSKIVQRFGLN